MSDCWFENSLGSIVTVIRVPSCEAGSPASSKRDDQSSEISWFTMVPNAVGVHYSLFFAFALLLPLPLAFFLFCGDREDCSMLRGNSGTLTAGMCFANSALIVEYFGSLTTFGKIREPSSLTRRVMDNPS